MSAYQQREAREQRASPAGSRIVPGATTADLVNSLELLLGQIHEVAMATIEDEYKCREQIVAALREIQTVAKSMIQLVPHLPGAHTRDRRAIKTKLERLVDGTHSTEGIDTVASQIEAGEIDVRDLYVILAELRAFIPEGAIRDAHRHDSYPERPVIRS